MTKILSVCVFMFMALAVCSPQDVATGNWLLTACQASVKALDTEKPAETSSESMQDGYCTGLVQGISYASPRVCPGEHVTIGQMIRVVLKYMQDHPEELDQKSGRLVERGLAKAFPCQKQ